MELTFRKHDETTFTAWYAIDSVEINDGGQIFYRDVYKDANGHYFDFDGHRYYTQDCQKYSCKEFLEDIENKKPVYDNEFYQMIISEGLDNIVFSIPMLVNAYMLPGGFTIRGDKSIPVDCHINKNTFSIFYAGTLDFVADDLATPTQTTDHYTVSDLVKLIKDNYITVKRRGEN